MSPDNIKRSGWPGTARTPLNGLDMALAQFCHSMQPSDDVRHRWLAALASGHACLDLQDWPQQAAEVLGWPAEQLQVLPAGLAKAAVNLPWAQGDNSPLVLEGHRLYLRRAWQAEQTIKQNLRERLQQSL